MFIIWGIILVVRVGIHHRNEASAPKVSYRIDNRMGLNVLDRLGNYSQMFGD